MNDPCLMGPGEPLRDVGRDPDRLRDHQGPLAQERPQSLSFDEFHDDEGDTVGLVDLVHHGDFGMGDGCGSLGLSQESTMVLWMSLQVEREDLDRHISIELYIVRPVDLAHPPLADLLKEAVMGKALARRNAHGQSSLMPCRERA